MAGKAAFCAVSKAIQLKPGDSAAFSARAHSLYAIGKNEESLADYAKAMDLSPDSAESATEYADTCQAVGKWKLAATAYQRAALENYPKKKSNR